MRITSDCNETMTNCVNSITRGSNSVTWLCCSDIHPQHDCLVKVIVSTSGWLPGLWTQHLLTQEAAIMLRPATCLNDPAMLFWPQESAARIYKYQSTFRLGLIYGRSFCKRGKFLNSAFVQRLKYSHFYQMYSYLFYVSSKLLPVKINVKLTLCIINCRLLMPRSKMKLYLHFPHTVACTCNIFRAIYRT
jgi:hypothetical protein